MMAHQRQCSGNFGGLYIYEFVKGDVIELFRSMIEKGFISSQPSQIRRLEHTVWVATCCQEYDLPLFLLS